jgi:hypothetical protein
MKDFNKNELAVGDFVAMLPPNYRHMVQGRVVGFTPKQIKIEWLPDYNRRHGRPPEVCTREPGYVAKIQPVDMLAE